MPGACTVITSPLQPTIQHHYRWGLSQYMWIITISVVHKIFQTVLANTELGDLVTTNSLSIISQHFSYVPDHVWKTSDVSIPPKLWRRTINKNKDAFSVLKILRVLLCFQVLSRSKEKIPTIESLLHTAFTSILKGINQHTERKHLESVDLQGYISAV